MAEARAALSCTETFHHRGTGEHRGKAEAEAAIILLTAGCDQPSWGLRRDDFGVQHGGESNPGAVGDEGIGGGAVDFARGGDVGAIVPSRARMSASASVGRCSPKKSFDHWALAASCEIQSRSAALRSREGAALQMRQPDQAIRA